MSRLILSALRTSESQYVGRDGKIHHCECIVDGCRNRISALDDQFWCGDHGGETVYETTDRRGLVAAQKEKTA